MDTVARFGGEEFAMILPNCAPFFAQHVAERIRAHVGSRRIDIGPGEQVSVTVSIGVAEIAGYETFENYLNAADQFLYMAKHKGRNLVYSDAKMTEEAAQ